MTLFGIGLGHFEANLVTCQQKQPVSRNTRWQCQLFFLDVHYMHLLVNKLVILCTYSSWKLCDSDVLEILAHSSRKRTVSAVITKI